MKKRQTRLLIALVVVAIGYAWYRREKYEGEKEKEEVKEVAQEKQMSQAELNAVLKFIK